MPFAEVIMLEVGSAIAKSILKLWIKDLSIVDDASSTLIDVLKAQTSDVIAQRRGQRQFERIGEKIGESLIPIFESEGAKLEDGACAAIAIAVAEAFNKSKISSRLLAEYNLEPSKLVHHVLNVNPNVTQYFTTEEASLYERIIKEACGYIIDIASQLPSFNERTFAEILKKEDQVLEKVQEVLQAIRRLQELQDPATLAGKFEIDYRLSTIRKFDLVQLFGITTSLVNRKHHLSSAYINLTVEQQRSILSEKESRDFSSLDKANFKLQGQTSQKTTKVDKALSESKRLLIRGAAGSGKTTLLQWIAISSADRSFDGYLTQWNDTVPFYIRLRQFEQTGLPSPQDFLRLTFPVIADLMPKGWVHLQLSSGRAIVLIDGLDELPVLKREEVYIWLKDLIANYPDARFLLTSRPHAFEEGWLDHEDFKYVELQPMELREIFSFVEHWHRAVKEELHDEEEKSDLEVLANHFKDIVKQSLSIRNLVANPLLCAMLCALHRDRRQELPADRIELYEACCESLIERRDKERHIPLTDYPILSYRQKRHILEDLAYWMIKNSWSEVAKEDVYKRVARKIKIMHGLPQDISASDVLKLLIERSGIIREPVLGRIDFMHHTFQDFLAVKSATDEMDTGLLLANAHNNQWREIIILTAGFATKQMRKKLIKGLIDRGNNEKENRYQLHLLAVSCLETCIDLEPSLKAEVVRHLEQLIPPQNITDAIAIAAAGDLALKHLVNREYSPPIMAVCIRALALIGGESALNILEGYTQTLHPLVIDELFKAWDYFDRETYATRILSQAYQRENTLALERLPSLSGFQSFTNVKSLFLFDCSSIKDFGPLAALTQLTSLTLSTGSNLNDLSPLKNMIQLTSLTLSGCQLLRDLNALKGLTQLTSLTLIGCPLLSDISALAHLTQLRFLNLLNCGQVSDLTPLASLTHLTSLDLNTCSMIQDLTPLTNLAKLKMLKIKHCYEIYNLAPLANLRELRFLNLFGCNQLHDLTPLLGLTKLISLFLPNSFDLISLKNLRNLVVLYLENCEQLSDLTPLSNCKQLGSLIMKQCHQLSDIEPLVKLESLKFLYISDSSNSIDLSSLTALMQLRNLSFINCTQINNIDLVIENHRVINIYHPYLNSVCITFE